MIQNIGKYRILERIGRGGMGTVFKAHDPVLDRLVALKVISSEGEITDELKTRFYREAQACARLTHPNIVVVHDLGEDAGRLFIVMEFLDGEELKQLIHQRRSLPLEDKISLMVQVCDGLQYAHQNGVIHRDIKPGNIFVLRNGQVKILDFGIARIATTDSGLTRTGLIMGTLRYMSPEQARGKVDHRSDMFSAGTVFYELLTYRAAFDSEDPMETLERLRSEDPPPLTQVDPTIPSDLAGIIEKALRKDPGQRFPDMGQMRARLEQLRRRTADEGERLQTHVRGQLDRVRELQRRLSDCLGHAPEDETVPVVDDRVRTSDLQALDRQLTGQLDRLRATVERAEALQPVVARASELLERGDFPAVAAQLEPIVREMPDHARAQEMLRQAKTRQEEVTRLLAEAKAAQQQQAYPRMLELLDRVATISAAAAGTPAAVEMRKAADTVSREQESAQRLREQAQQARAAAEQAEAARYAAAVWTEAEAKAAEATAALGQRAYRNAEARWKEAAAGYERAAAAARQAAEAVRAGRARAEEAGRGATQARQVAGEANAATYAAAKWSAAQAKEASAQTAVGREDHGTAQTLFGEARRLYDEAARDARAGAEAETQRRAAQAEADRVRQAVVAARRAAEEAGARQFASEAFAKAEAADKTATESMNRQAFAEAVTRLRKAEQAYQEVTRQAAEAARAARARAEEAAQAAAQAKQAAAALNAPASAAAKWTAAQARETTGQSALTRGDYAQAQTQLGEARGLYEEAAREARAAADTEARRKAAAAEAARLRQAVATARRAAEEAGAAQLAAAPLGEAQAAEQAGEAALGRQQFTEAQTRFRAAEQAYQQAAKQAATQQAVGAALADAQRLIGEGRPDRALEALGRAREVQPNHPDIAKLEAQARRTAEAQKTREHVRSLIDQARRFQARHEFVRGLALAEEAVQLAPDDARAVRLRDDLMEAVREAGEVPTVAAPPTRAPAAATPAAEAPAAPAPAARPARAEAPAPTAEPAAPRAPAPAATRSFGKTPVAIAAAVLLAVGGGVAYYATRPDVPKPGPIRPDPGKSDPGKSDPGKPDPGKPDPGKPEPPSPERLKAEELRKSMIAAREEGRKQDAERLAPKLWAAAADKERDAEAALGKQEFTRAIAGYTDAEQGYRKAVDQSAKDRQVAEFRPLQDQVAQARRKAEVLDAAKSAAPLWTKAAGIEKSADEALGKQEYDRARGLYREAVLAYQAAEADANQRNLISEQEKKARQAAADAKAAREAAEQAEAPRYASKLLAAAGDKEKEGQVAFAKPDYGAAEARFREARLEYERAKQAAETAKRELARLQQETEQVRELMGRSRQAAEQADASRLAARLFAAASDKEKEGQLALGKQDYPAAQARFKEARLDYDQAKQAAEAAKRDLARLQQETEQLRDQMGKSRQAAEQAEASRYAPKLLAVAGDKEKEGQLALGKQDYPAAQARFKEARLEYDQAKQAAEAAKRDLARLQQETEQLRDQMGKSRQAAEQADASRLASRVFAAASDKEKEGQAAFGKQDYPAAQARFKEAQREYENARTAAINAADIDKRFREARDVAEAARKLAVAAEADKLARDLFEAGRSRETQADGLGGGQKFAEAIAAYQDAAGKYGDAVKRAGPRKLERAEADQARARMQDEKKKARPDAPDYRSALTEEQQGDATYQRLAFKEATGHYGTAQGLFARASVPVPAPTPVPTRADPKTEVMAALGTLKKAFDEKDVNLYQQIYPGITSDGLRSVRQGFDLVSRQTTEFRDVTIDINGDEAQARGKRVVTFVPKSGGRSDQREGSFSFKLKRTPSGWVIVDMK